MSKRCQKVTHIEVCSKLWEELPIHLPSHFRISHFPKISQDATTNYWNCKPLYIYILLSVTEKNVQIFLDIYFPKYLCKRNWIWYCQLVLLCGSIVQRTESWDIVFLIFRLFSWVQNQDHMFFFLSSKKATRMQNWCRKLFHGGRWTHGTVFTR